MREARPSGRTIIITTAGEQIRAFLPDPYLQQHAFVRVPEAAKKLPLSGPTIQSAVRSLEDQGVVRETTGGERNRLWAYSRYLAILSEGVGAGG